MMNDQKITIKKLLNGHGETPGIVALHQSGPNTIQIYYKQNGSVYKKNVKFYPFFYLTDSSLLPKFEGKYWCKKLEGDGEYKYLLAFESWSDMWRALKTISQKLDPKRTSNIINYKEIYLRTDPISQFMLQSGETFFKDMDFSDLIRMQLDIETYSGGGFSQAHRPKDKIIIVALSDSTGWKKIIHSKKISEKELLEDLIKTIKERDPDIIEGHNILGFDLPYIIARCQLYGIKFSIGRDGSEPFIDYNTNYIFWGKKYPEISIQGRQIVDTLHLVFQYDMHRRDIEDYSLKTCAQYFGVNVPGRKIIPGDRISYYWNTNPDAVIEYALQDVLETKAMSEILMPVYFYQAQMIPMDFSQILRSGVSAKIELMLVREYLRQRYSLPMPQVQTKSIVGGYTNVFYSGVFEKIIHADIESLYPSVILHKKISPKSDSLNVFLKLLEALTKERLRLKRLKGEETDQIRKMQLDSMQSAYKILINSFYGYLGFYKAIFNDYDAANEVTTYGQKILNFLINEFKKENCTVIEVDTDGLYISPLNNEMSEEKERELVQRVNSRLPEGFNLSFAGRYAKMLSYKKKNYALLTYDNQLIIKGSALISKSIEKYARKFIAKCIELILQNRLKEITDIYLQLKKDLLEHKVPIDDLVKTEVLYDTLEEYEKAVNENRRARNAAYELAKRMHLGGFRRTIYPGEKISYYVIGNNKDVSIFENCKLREEFNPSKPDYNSAYYIKKLEDYVLRFENLFSPEDFKVLFPESLAEVPSLFEKREPKIISKQITEE